jgi:CubicO group peptidase (beta-lactamase class C family)
LSFTQSQTDIIHSFMEERDVPGCAIALVRDGEIFAEGGFGLANIDSQTKPTAASVWPIASITKSFTSVAAMQCVELGLLDLDVPVSRYLPELRVASPDISDQLSMRRLLTHTSGLGRTGHQDRTREEAQNPFPTREALLAALHDVVPQAPVGSAFSYSNESYAIAGHLIETLRGQSLESCFEDYIFDPVGMSRTVPRFSAWREEPDRAVLYAGDGIGPYGAGRRHGGYEVVELVEDYRTFLSTGGIASTAHDLALYQLATMNYDDSPLGLSAGALDHAHSAQHLFGDSGWGYGLGYYAMRAGAARVIGHSGGLPGVSTYSLMIPSQRTGVVVLTNRSDIKAIVLAERLMGDLHGPLWREDTSSPLPISSGWSKPEPADLEPFCGDYTFRRGPAQVKDNGRGLTISTPSRYDGPVRHLHTLRVARDRFMCLDDGHVVDFVRNADGAVVGFINSGYRYERAQALI